jgi:cytochrome c oxidase assembly factor CtaG
VALPPLSPTGVFTHFALDPLVLLAVIGAGFWYFRGLRRLARARQGKTWPRRRTASFTTGLVLTAWVSCGGLQAYYPTLLWVWTAQILTLLLVTPILLMAGQPVELDRRLGGGVLSRIVASPPARVVGSPFIGPALIPVLSAGLFFGPLPGWSVQFPPVAWLVALVVTGIGAVIVLPALDVREVRTSVLVGLAMTVGFFELLLDAIPGIVLRLQTHRASTFFDQRHLHSWSPGWLHDQQLAGAVLWTVAEVLDLPFLIVLFLRWYRTDVREAGDVDAVLDAEQIVRSAARGSVSPATTDPLTNTTGTATDPAVAGESVSDDPPADDVEPWWLDDPVMRARMRRQG